MTVALAQTSSASVTHGANRRVNARTSCTILSKLAYGVALPLSMGDIFCCSHFIPRFQSLAAKRYFPRGGEVVGYLTVWSLVKSHTLSTSVLILNDTKLALCVDAVRALDERRRRCILPAHTLLDTDSFMWHVSRENGSLLQSVNALYSHMVPPSRK